MPIHLKNLSRFFKLKTARVQIGFLIKNLNKKMSKETEKEIKDQIF